LTKLTKFQKRSANKVVRAMNKDVQQLSSSNDEIINFKQWRKFWKKKREPEMLLK